MKNKQSSILPLLLIGLLVGIAIGAVAAVIVLQKPAAPVTPPTDVTTNTPPVAPLPTDTTPPPADWLTVNNAGAHVAFSYPTDLGTDYVSTQDWPPAIAVMPQAFTCVEGGTSQTLPAGITTKETINGHTYCVTREGEGAAGSTYTQYAYAFAKDDKTVILTFTLRTVQCLNYEDPQKTACQTEQGSFNSNTLADQMAQTVTWL